MILDSSLGIFIGRFHPLLVHLPIGFVLMAILMELFARKFQELEKASTFVWLLGALSSFMAAFCGWFLAQEGGYASDTLFWHRWSGILLTILTTLIWIAKKEWIPHQKLLIQGVMALIFLLLMFTGHLGGNLTHGSNYLVQYAPGFIQSLFGAQQKNQNLQKLNIKPDSILVYQDLIQPIFEEKCLSCHNNDKLKGGLLLDSVQNLIQGGDHGVVINPGKSFDSEIIKRVTLPQSDPLFMPPSGEGLTYQEIKLLAWWIDAKAPIEQRLAAYQDISLDMQFLLLDQYGLDTREKSYLEKTQVAKLSDNKLKELQRNGFTINIISQENGFLEVTYKETLKQSSLDNLLTAKNQITWLNLGQTLLKDNMIATLAKLPNLTRLRLENNPITDQAIASLHKLEHLESLNLYNTEITDQALEHIKKIKSLKKLYLWQNQISIEAIEQLQNELPHLEIDTGFRFTQKTIEP